MTDYLQQQIDDLRSQIGELNELADDPEMAELATADIAELKSQIAVLQKAISDTENGSSDDENGPAGDGPKANVAVLEIRQAAGGDEAKIWATDLLRMYLRYAQIKKWKVKSLDELTIKIKGKNVYPLLQYEAGVHRVQRVPVTESQGRIHTSTATVAILPEIAKTAVDLDQEDVEFISFKRSSGAGGQNVNKVSSAVRLKHRATGIVVESSSERTQVANRQLAEQLLAARIWDLREQKRLELLGDARAAIGRGMRAEKIRTYNYPQNRVTDHRIGKSWHNLDAIIDGQLDKVLAALQQEMTGEVENEEESE